MAVSPVGVVTGFVASLCCFHYRPAGSRDSLRRAPPAGSEVAQRWVCFAGTVRGLLKGFEGAENHQRWHECYGARVIHPPKNAEQPQTLVQALEALWVAVRYARSWRASTTNSSTPSISTGSDLTIWEAYGHVWRRSLSAAQLLHLAQRATRPLSTRLRRPTAMVSTTHTMRFRPQPSRVAATCYCFRDSKTCENCPVCLTLGCSGAHL